MDELDHNSGLPGALTADLAQFYNMSLDDVWAGRVPVSRALVLVEHLMLTPLSRCRAIRFGGDPGWIGWDHTTEAIASLVDTVVAVAAGKKYTDALRYGRPSGVKQANAPETELFAPSIADFGVAKFMGEINK